MPYPSYYRRIAKCSSLSKNPDGVESLSFIFSDYYLCRKLTSMERINILTDVASHFPLKIFTPNNNYVIPNASNMGVADYLTETPYIFHDSKINLNITLRSIKSGIPLRCMEIMSCGGFLLTNFQSDFFKHFVAGEDFVYFESNDDMLQKIDYYLTHEKERASIAESGYQKVIKTIAMKLSFNKFSTLLARLF